MAAEQAAHARSRDTDDDIEMAEMREWFRQLWPRIRNNTENIEHVKNELEDLCRAVNPGSAHCTVKLNEPEKF
jgi:hypothetical protein